MTYEDHQQYSYMSGPKCAGKIDQDCHIKFCLMLNLSVIFNYRSMMVFLKCSIQFVNSLGHSSVLQESQLR